MALFATLGIRNSFGAYVTLWEDAFQVSRTMVASISTLSLAFYGLGQPLAGRLMDRWGGRIVLSLSLGLVGLALMLSAFATQYWQLLFLYGVLLSLGAAGASNVTATALVSKWFVKKQGLAMGLVLAGMAAGPLILVPLTMYLLETIDWRWTLFSIGLGTGLVLAPLTFLFVRSYPKDKGLAPYGAEENHGPKKVEPAHGGTSPDLPLQKGMSVKEMLTNRLFWMMATAFFVCGFTDLGLIFTHLIPYVEEKGFSSGLIGAGFSVIATFNLIGTVSSGYLADRMHRSRLLAMIYAFRGLTLILLLMVDSAFLFVLFALSFGLTEVAALAPGSSLSADLFGQKSVGLVFGVISLCHQIGAAVGSFVSGLIYDLFGSYDYAILLSIGLLAISSLIVVRVPDRREQKESSLESV